MIRKKTSAIESMYERLYAAFGPQHWWPGDTPFEIMVGAILTQNTNWSNVERAIANMKAKQLLTPQKLKAVHSATLARLIRPSGYFNVKTKRLKNFMTFWFNEYEGKLSTLRKEDTKLLREAILAVNGIGPETADSILLYALEKPVFVVDAYTRRVLYRHGFVQMQTSYDDLQLIFVKQLPEDVELFNEFHALIVKLGKEYCRPHPRCEECPLNAWQYNIKNRCSRCYRRGASNTMTSSKTPCCCV